MMRRVLVRLLLISIGLWLALGVGGGFGAEKTLAGTVAEVRIAASSDDAEEDDSGSVTLTSSDLELVYDGGQGNQRVGLRFNGIEIPQGATVNAAHIQFQADETGSEQTDLTIHGEDADHALTFVASDGNVSSRRLTEATVFWPSVPAWPAEDEAGPDQRTPDIASIVQEIVDRPGWAGGNSLALIITGSGRRAAEAFDGEQTAAPLLHVEYTVDPPALTPTPTPTGTPPGSGVVRVPEDYAAIQAAIDAAADGDLVLVGPGTYIENLTVAGKSVILASHFHTTGDDSFIEQTIIDGRQGLAAGLATIAVAPTAGPQTRITGFTIQNGDDGILAEASLEIDHNLVVNNVDGIDYEDGAGRCHDNVFQSNRDDGIDLDGDTAAIVENNLIHFNDDDGIEIRLHEYSGPTLTITLRGNVIHANGEDGIQLIDYPDLSDRVFHIERNRITNNAMVGLGLMDGGITREDFRAAPIPERIHLYHNTFSGNPYAVTGGANLVALNNLFVDANTLALKNLVGDTAGSIAAYNLFWNNGVDYMGSNVDAATSVFGDPLLDVYYRLRPGSPAIDAGAVSFVWDGETVLDMPADQYNGSAPDLGWSETGASAPTATPTATNTPTNTPAPTATPTITPAATNTPTNTPAATNTPTNTPTATNIPTNTPTATNTPTSTPTSTPSPTATPTNTPTATNTPASPPTANDDYYSTGEGTPLTVAAPGVLANDSDANADPLTALLDTPPGNGSLTLNLDGAFTYRPDANFTGVDTFSYHANDGTANSNVATVTITVNALPLSVTGIDPASAPVGRTVQVTVSGTGFRPGASLSLEKGVGPAPDVTGVVVVDGFTLNATLTVKQGGPPKDRTWDVQVTNPDGQTDVLPAGFTVTMGMTAAPDTSP